jgi:transcriptional regulator with XRE-family HTH domain
VGAEGRLVSATRIATDGPDARPGAEPPVAEKDDVTRAPDIGSLLRGLRRQHGLSLSQVAKACGLSASFLSAVERGRSDISVQRLARVAAVFHHDLGSLLGYSSRRSTPQWIREGDRIAVDRGEGIRYEAIRIPGTGLELFVASLAPRSAFLDPLTHAGLDVCYVAEGKLVLELDGSEYPLREGECLTWPGSYPHRLRNDSDSPARVVAVTTEIVY